MRLVKEGKSAMKILFVDSGIGGIAERYAYDIFHTLRSRFVCTVERVNPRAVTPETFRRFRPNVLLVVHGTLMRSSLVRYAGEWGATTVLWLVEDPYEIDFHRGEMTEVYDYVFTNERQAVGEYGRSNVFYLPWCCNPRVHKTLRVGPSYLSDIAFIGMGFPNRLRVVNALAEEFPGAVFRLIGDWASWGKLHPRLHDAVLPTLSNFWEVQRFYNGAAINLNIHRDPVDPPSGNRRGIGATSPNDRVFALAGCGAFQLVDDTRPDIWDCFAQDREMVAFRSIDDLVEKVRYYLTSPDRVRVAKAAQIRAYRDHTFARRLEEIFRRIKKPLEEKK